MNIPHLSVVIPCYNELKNLENGALLEVHDYLTELHEEGTWEVIVVNDESTDGSAEFVQNFVRTRPHFTSVDIKHGGKPAAVWAGIQIARGDIVLFTDMDQSTPLKEWQKLSPLFDQGFDVVIGSRGGEREGFSSLRQLGSRAFRGFRKTLLLAEIEDTQCGFKACRREHALEFFPRLSVFETAKDPRGWKVSAFDVELLYFFASAGLKIGEVPIEWMHRDLSDTKGAVNESQRYVFESYEMLKEVLRVRLNVSRGVYSRTNKA
jgi:dolichyl-phosphate beta-glucosyltransferase